MAATMEKVCVLGSGNWGSTAGKIVASNAARLDDVASEVNMWVFEEQVDGRKLTEIINEDHENPKYLPGVKLPENLVAVPDAAAAVSGATLLIFCLPHQFLPRLCASIKDAAAPGARAITLIKGFDVDDDGIVLLSEYITAQLGMPCAVLMGANIANEVAREEFSETTIGYHHEANGKLWCRLFQTKYFRVAIVPDPVAVELCGAIKNVVALGAGFCDGLKLGNNTKAAVIRIGLLEMRQFTQTFFNGAGELTTYFESCGLADLITTCYGGRNRKCAEAFVASGKSWDELEAELLGGQKLQGTLTTIEVIKAIDKAGARGNFPLFTAINAICFEGAAPSTLFDNLVHDDALVSRM
ncbi:glycerol-3-phosphate dehydrogenase [NAD+] [Thecamonas trahens ATCC 50062]|uniref:Glycerol-3-phosphate dehydrogenase [NAD(+)] n=1 Tax=Thecamonas trahens ATCC 50062 TaxID=461836 RepID=A0A0L0DMG1_THETB|nr:glycerol-3-phosphate dehydrogenase [NAD+] [Thecamonas trahens ATCC 50062]KNC53509.1 glycerol-3-phosphate dehydrogenase [NAD+] [Thecamonas trahens ATCC 50062]|eukprot:XP_013761830.1 glycerol-3-phosphate dehydrogenase [NAD+] [Thecamonas trahens ATCC 50062]